LPSLTPARLPVIPRRGLAEIGQLPVASPGPGLVRTSAQPNGREFALPTARRENRMREWSLPAGDLTECYVDLVRSAMGIPG